MGNYLMSNILGFRINIFCKQFHGMLWKWNHNNIFPHKLALIRILIIIFFYIVFVSIYYALNLASVEMSLFIT